MPTIYIPSTNTQPIDKQRANQGKADHRLGVWEHRGVKPHHFTRTNLKHV